MSMNALIWILLAVALIVVWRWLAHRTASAEAANDDPQPTPFHAVAVVAGPGACQTSKSLRNVRFLSAEAPLLPLVSCDAERCNCKFAHFSDRRRGDRRNAYSAQSHGYSIQGGEERRRRRGRRTSDGMQMAAGL